MFSRALLRREQGESNSPCLLTRPASIAVVTVAIVRRHFLEKVPVLDLCDQNHLNSTLFHRWQAEARRRGSTSEDSTSGKETPAIHPGGEANAGALLESNLPGAAGRGDGYSSGGAYGFLSPHTRA